MIDTRGITSNANVFMAFFFCHEQVMLQQLLAVFSTLGLKIRDKNITEKFS